MKKEPKAQKNRGEKASAPSSVKTLLTEDKRQTARQEHTNHFTNRAPEKK